MCVKLLQSCLTLLILQKVAHQTPLSKRMLQWVDMPSPGDLPDPSIEPTSLTTPALVEGFFVLFLFCFVFLFFCFFTISATLEAQLEDRMGDVKCFW